MTQLGDNNKVDSVGYGNYGFPLGYHMTQAVDKATRGIEIPLNFNECHAEMEIKRNQRKGSNPFPFSINTESSKAINQVFPYFITLPPGAKRSPVRSKP